MIEERPFQAGESRRAKNLLANLAAAGCLGLGCFWILFGPTLALLAVAAIYYFVSPTAGRVALAVAIVGGLVLAIVEFAWIDRRGGKRPSKQARTANNAVPPAGHNPLSPPN